MKGKNHRVTKNHSGPGGGERSSLSSWFSWRRVAVNRQVKGGHVCAQAGVGTGLMMASCRV